MAEAVGYRQDASRKDEQGQGGVSVDECIWASPSLIGRMCIQSDKIGPKDGGCTDIGT